MECGPLARRPGPAARMVTPLRLGRLARPAAASAGPLPESVVDPHFHYYDSGKPEIYSFVSGFGLPEACGAPAYQPADYRRDFAGLNVTKTVHVEVLPDQDASGSCDGEVVEVERLAATGECELVAGIVAACDLSQPAAAVEAQLDAIQAASDKVRGIRWITNYAGDLRPGEAAIASRATWPRVARDFSTCPDFGRGLSMLPPRGLSFDLQANPDQLERWANALAAHPDLAVVVDHVGSLRGLGGEGNEEADDAQLAVWRAGLSALAEQTNAHMKLSMLGYAVPLWHTDERKAALAREIVETVIGIFGTDRCFFASNWPVDGEDGIGALEMYEHYASWVAHRSVDEQAKLFSGNAARFYRL